MDSYITQRFERLKVGESLNITNTSSDGKGIKRVRFNPMNSRSLIEVPGYQGFVFNPNLGFEGLDNFLYLMGNNKSQIKRIHRYITNPKGFRKRNEDREVRKDLYLIIHIPPKSDEVIFQSGNDKIGYHNGYYFLGSKYLNGFDPYDLSRGLIGYFYNSQNKYIRGKNSSARFLAGVSADGDYANIPIGDTPFISLSDRTTVTGDISSGNGHSFLFPGDTLYQGQHLISPNRQYKLEYQASDGNLVIYYYENAVKVVWECGGYTYHPDTGFYIENNNPGQDCEVNQCPPNPYGIKPLPGMCGSTCHVNNAYLTFQGDGNLVLYHPVKKDPNDPNKPLALWASGPQNSNNPYLILQDNGMLAIYANGEKVWSCQGDPNPNPVPTSESLLYPKDQLTRGQRLRSSNGKYQFLYQDDGNLVIYGPDGYAKGILPCGRYNPQNYDDGKMPPFGVLKVEEDGNLVLYPSGGPLWASNPRESKDTYLKLEDNGELNLYVNGSKVWSC